MVSLTCATDRRAGVTLVTARLDGSGVAQRVRLTNRLDGPVWPPRRNGVPEAGWEEGGFEAVVPADGTVAIGYASPGAPDDPPVEVVDREMVPEGVADDQVTAAAALRDLGDPSPPRDAVPVSSPERSRPETDQRPASRQSPGSPGTGRPTPDCSAAASTTPSSSPAPSPAPEAIDGWLDAVEERIATAERLTAARSVPEATAALRDVGSLDDAEKLVEAVDGDVAALTTVAERVEELAERAEETDVPVETLERLA